MNKGRLSEEFRGRTKAFALEAEASELVAILTTMIKKTKDKPQNSTQK